MSAPSIPNLLSLRGNRNARGGFRGRARGANRPGGPQADAAVQGTDTDAAVSRMSAVDLGYLTDEYAPYFVSRADGPPTRRLPIINRGTYARTAALDRLVDAFLSEDGAKERQIISLGAGTDTRPFRLFSQRQQKNITYHELDFSITSSRKAHTVRASPVLSNILTNVAVQENGDWSSKPTTGGEYYCHGIDIRQFGTPEEKPITGLRNDIPTLLLSECCLCYLKPEESQRVIEFFMTTIADLAVVLYEPMHLDDAFGSTMVSNLAARGIRMPGLEQYRNAKDQVKRLQDLGFQTVKYMSIDNIWDRWVGEDEQERLHNLEGLDEVEEWKLLASHYLVCWALRGQNMTGLNSIPGNT